MPWLRVFAAYATPLVDIISVIGRWLDSKGHYHGPATTPPNSLPHQPTLGISSIRSPHWLGTFELRSW